MPPSVKVCRILSNGGQHEGKFTHMGSSRHRGSGGMGLFKGFPSSSPWTTLRGESQMGKGKMTVEE